MRIKCRQDALRFPGGLADKAAIKLVKAQPNQLSMGGCQLYHSLAR